MPIALQVLAGKVRYFCYTVSFTVIHMWLTFVQVYKKKETELLLVLIYFSTVLFSFFPHFLGDAFVCCCLL